MEAAVRAFEDWEFSVLERESSIEEEDESAASAGENEGKTEKEILCQQHAVSAAQVHVFFERKFHSCCPSCCSASAAYLHVPAAHVIVYPSPDDVG